MSFILSKNIFKLSQIFLKVTRFAFFRNSKQFLLAAKIQNKDRQAGIAFSLVRKWKMNDLSGI
jgi:hypothetical protein